MRHRPLVLASLLAAAAALLPACETTRLFPTDPESHEPDDEEWQATEPLAAPSFALLWQRARATLEVTGWDVDEDRTHFERRELTTKWVTSMGRNQYDGVRRRAVLRFDPVEGSRWIVRCAVLKQRNADIDDPMNPAQAQWEPMGCDVSRTGLLLFRIRAGLAPAEAAE